MNDCRSTANLYKSRQKDFIEWCRATYRHQRFPELVTEEKLLAFLEFNKGRTSKKNPNKVVGIQTYLSYVSAVVDLYNTQVIMFSFCLLLLISKKGFKLMDLIRKMTE